MKALDKERGRRYQTASDFASDVGRFLSGETVLACPPTVQYRATKFLRRYRTPVAIASAFFLVLSASSILAWSLYARASASEKDALRAQRTANAQQVKAEENLAVAEERREQLEVTANELERQLQRATVQRLAAQAQAIKTGEPVTSVLLAAKSVELSRSSGEEIDSSVLESLMSALGELGGDPVLHSEALVKSVATSPDGSWVVAGTTDGSLHLFTALEELRLAPRKLENAHEGAIDGLIVTRNGLIISGGADGWIRRWRFSADSTPQLLDESDMGATVQSLAESPDESMFAAAVGMGIHVWNAAQWPGEPVRRFEVHQNGVRRFAFTGDSKRIVAIDNVQPPVIHALDLESDQHQVVRAHENHIAQLVSAPNESWFATTSWDKTVRLWRIPPDGEEYKATILSRSSKAFEGLALSPDQRWLAAGSDDLTIRVLDLEAADIAASEVELRGHTNEIWKLAFTPDSRRLISGSDDTKLRVWSRENASWGQVSRTLAGHQREIRGIKVDPRGRWLVSSDGKSLRRWDLTVERPGRTFPDLLSYGDSDYDPYYAVRVRLSADDRFVACGDNGRGVRVWDLEDREAPPIELLRHDRYVGNVEFGPLGRYLFSGGYDGRVLRWDLTTQGASFTELLHLKNGRIRSLIVAPNNLLAVVSGDDVLSLLRHHEDGAELISEVSLGRLASFVMRPRSFTGWSLNETGDLLEWHLDGDAMVNGGNVGRVREHTVMQVADSGTRLAVGTRTGGVHVFNIGGDRVEKETELRCSSVVSSIAFSSDGERLYVGDRDKILRVWNLDKSTTDPSITIHGHYFSSIDVTGDGNTLVSGGRFLVPRLWALDPDELVQRARAKAGRDLTEAEHLRFEVSDHKNRVAVPRIAPEE